MDGTNWDEHVSQLLQNLFPKLSESWFVVNTVSPYDTPWPNAVCNPHPLFDAGWYLATYPEVTTDPLGHYLSLGASQLRLPNPFFDSPWYRQQMGEMQQWRNNPLVHYISQGAGAGAAPSGHFDLGEVHGSAPGSTALATFMQREWGRNRRRALAALSHLPDPPVSQLRTIPRADPYAETSAGPLHQGSRCDLPAFHARGTAAWDQHGEATLQSRLNSTDCMSFPKFETPQISIVIPLFNKATLTVLCLEAILQQSNVSYEVILVDNGSTDHTKALLERLTNVKTIVNAQNEGFGHACVQGTGIASGEYLCFLNSDALLHPGCLERAAAVLRSASDIGAVGGKLLFADGKLQEAGAMVWSDGTAWGYGRGDDPDQPQFNFRRAVDYCSAAFLVTRRILFEALGGFDSQYAPAYYEDSDYCLQLWKQGYRVLYEPTAVVSHYESASAISAGSAANLLNANRRKFVAKWKHELERKYHLVSENMLSARLVTRQSELRILVVGQRSTTAGLSPQAAADLCLLQELLAEGHQVSWVVGDSCNGHSRAGIPEGVELIAGGENVHACLREYLPHCDVLWILNSSDFDRCFRRGALSISGQPPLVVCTQASQLAQRAQTEKQLSKRGDDTPSQPLINLRLTFMGQGRRIALIRRSGLFDEEWYLQQNPDVAACGMDPIAHYLLHGAAEGRDPSPLFWSTWYTNQETNPRYRTLNPLLHYILIGGRAGRNPNPLLDEAWYVREHPELGRLEETAFSDYRRRVAALKAEVAVS